MTVLHEAFVLPAIFLTVTLLGGMRVGASVRLLPPSLFSLVLGVLLTGAIVRAGALDPRRLLNARRARLENVSGAVVLLTLVAASAQIFNLVTPESGLLNALFNAFFLIEVLTTLAGVRGRTSMTRALTVLFGAAFALRFLVLEPFFAPEGGILKRVVTAALQGLTLGTLEYEPNRTATGYLALLGVCLYLGGVALLPAPLGGQPVRSNDQLIIGKDR